MAHNVAPYRPSNVSGDGAGLHPGWLALYWVLGIATVVSGALVIAILVRALIPVLLAILAITVLARK